jgi:hypothetical protein
MLVATFTQSRITGSLILSSNIRTNLIHNAYANQRRGACAPFPVRPSRSTTCRYPKAGSLDPGHRHDKTAARADGIMLV